MDIDKIKVLSGDKADDPNRSALTLEISKKDIGGLDDDILRVTLSRGEAATSSSPFIENMYNAISVLQRVDLLSKNDNVWITFHIHPSMMWGQEQIDDLKTMLSDHLSEENKLINSAKLKSEAECFESLGDKEGLDKKLHEIFRDKVNPIVSQHRGALELVENIKEERKSLFGKSKGTEITSVVAAFGACGNCPIAGTTLKMATPLVAEEFNAYAKLKGENVTFKGIEILKRGKGLVILRPKSI